MLSEECKKDLALFVRNEYGIGGFRFPMFLAGLETILDAHSQPGEKDVEPVIVNVAGVEYIKVPGKVSRCSNCVGSFSFDLCQELRTKCGKDDIFVANF